MKIKSVIAGIMLCLAVTSCIQNEALNVEAAIDGCSGSDIQQCLIDPNESPYNYMHQELPIRLK